MNDVNNENKQIEECLIDSAHRLMHEPLTVDAKISKDIGYDKLFECIIDYLEDASIQIGLFDDDDIVGTVYDPYLSAILKALGVCMIVIGQKENDKQPATPLGA